MKIQNTIVGVDWNSIKRQKQTLMTLIASEKILGSIIVTELKEILNTLTELEGLKGDVVDTTGSMSPDESIVINYKPKSIMICSNCGSDNVLTIGSINDRTQTAQGYCSDCCITGEIHRSEFSETDHIIGFQVIKTKDGELHDSITYDNQIYDISQCKDMMRLSWGTLKNNSYKLLSIWNIDIDNPKVMFDGDMRD